MILQSLEKETSRTQVRFRLDTILAPSQTPKWNSKVEDRASFAKLRRYEYNRMTTKGPLSMG
jgi:hypothetical protein